jgi:hypothetical protein
MRFLSDLSLFLSFYGSLGLLAWGTFQVRRWVDLRVRFYEAN